MNKVLTRAVLLGGLLAGVFVLSALAEEFPFRSAIIGSNPNTVIGGVASGGAPWTVHRGSAALTGDGRLRVEIAGLTSLVWAAQAEAIPVQTCGYPALGQELSWFIQGTWESGPISPLSTPPTMSKFVDFAKLHPFCCK